MSDYLVTIPIAGVMKVKVEAESAAEAEAKAKSKQIFKVLDDTDISVYMTKYDDLHYQICDGECVYLHDTETSIELIGE